MSLPGHNPEASMLQGGEGVNIAPNQAGGGLLKGGEEAPINPSQAGGGPFDDLTPEEQDQVKSVAAYVVVKNQDNKFLSRDEVEANAIEASTKYAAELLKRKTEAGDDSDVLEGANEAEKAAAKVAVVAVETTPEFEARTPEQKVEDIKITALAAIIRERSKHNIKVVKAREALKATMMTTQYSREIQALEERPVFTEFYHITDINSTKEIDKYHTIFQLKYAEMHDDLRAKKMRINMFNDVQKYKQMRIQQWNQVYKTSDKKVNPIIPIIRQDAEYSRREILTMFSRYIYSLPFGLDTVIVVPPIKGDIDTFVKVLYRLEKIGALTYKKVAGKDIYKIKAGLTIVFLSSFYASNIADPKSIHSNVILFSVFIDMNRTNPNQVFVLSENTVDNYNIGVVLSKTFTGSDIYKSSPLTMLEPSYIIYPYTREGLKDGFVISASTDEEPSLPQLNKFGLQDFKVNKEFGKALGLAMKPDGSNTPENLEMFAIRSSIDEGGIQQKVKYDLNHPPGHCDGLLESPRLDELSKETVNKYSSAAFFLKPLYIIKNGKALNNEKAILTIKLNPNGDHAPLCTSALSSTAPPLTKRDLHEPSDKADPNVDRVQVDIKGRIYSIRVPDETVSTNWKKREFTKDEVDFLNTTRLRPGVLQGVFGENWHINLASFLYTFTMSSCMSDNSLLTKRECYSCRQFLEDINIYFINNSLQLDLQDSKFNKYADDLYDEEALPVKVHKDHAIEANEAERKMHKLAFGNISSYTHPATSERRAFIIGLNQKTGMYKYYVVSVPSALTEIGTPAANKEEGELVKKVEALGVTYPDNIFIY